MTFLFVFYKVQVLSSDVFSLNQLFGIGAVRTVYEMLSGTEETG